MEHFFEDRNSGKSFDQFRKIDLVNLYCKSCESEWAVTKQAYRGTPKCFTCQAMAKSALFQFPQIADWVTDDLKLESAKSGRLLSAQCPDCKVFFNKTVSSFVSDFSREINPCGRCNPRHRVRNGIVFLKNYPQHSHQLLSDLGGREDIPLNTQENFEWLKDCGHTEKLGPLAFLEFPKKCMDCRHPHRSLKTQICSSCERDIVLSKFDKSRAVAEGDQFKCQDCKELERVRSNGLLEKTANWQRMIFAEDNIRPLESLSASSAERVKWKCKAANHLIERFAYASIDSCSRCEGSSLELKVESLLESVDLKIIRNDRSIIAPYELDFYFPDRKIAIEVNGVYWHSDSRGSDRYAHLRKFNLCRDAGVQLLTIWEDDLLEKPEVVKSMLLHKLGESYGERVDARKSRVVSLDHRAAADFFEAHHIQGPGKANQIYGLEIDGSPIAVMSFLVSKKDPSKAELTRYSTSKIVRGGFSKLLAAFLRANADVKELKSFSSNEVSDGSIYEANGFTRDGELPPDYSYFYGKRRVHKFNFRLKRFRADPLLSYEDGLSESQLAELNGIPKIWDSGKVRWVLKV